MTGSSGSGKKAVIYATGERGVYVGRLEKRFRRASVPATLLVSLDGDLEVRDPLTRERTTSRSVLIPSGTELEYDTHGSQVVMFFLDPLGTDLARVRHLMRSVTPLGNQYVMQHLDGLSDVIQFANTLRNQRPPLDTVIRIAEEWLSDPRRQVDAPDPRVLQAVQLLKTHYDRNISVEWVAAQVGLSVPRLSQLFRQVTGTSMRRFRLWHRIFVTAAELARGTPLTEAAVHAGFSDYAQFSRTYRTLVGACPSHARDNTELHLTGFLV
ncbi:AraC family transcriptional regulator [Hahella sp. SMD15-11]|uniref:AraC family transcriptional regulator n=1 Tax=Thermohahella caldifontis TaxID=3142973 RepID=A0AB39UTI4_9GAMM